MFPLVTGYWLLITSAHAASSPDSALDAYRRGNFRSAEAQYSQLAKQKADDARLRFNAAAAAYKNNDLTNAASWFESASGAPDLNLQQQAYYNLGNTRYQLGKAAQDPQERLKEWEQSLQHYGSALKLNQADTNAAANQAFVQQALAQLKQQLPQQQQQGKDSKDKQDKKDAQQGQSGQPQDQNEDQSKDQKDQQQQQEQKDQQAKSGQQKEDDQKPGDQSQDKDAGKDPQDQDQQAQQPKDAKESKAQQAQKAGEESGKDGAGGEAESFAEQQGKPGEMSPVQAERLLDQQKGEEKALIFRSAGSGKEAGQRQRRKMKQW